MKGGVEIRWGLPFRFINLGSTRPQKAVWQTRVGQSTHPYEVGWLCATVAASYICWIATNEIADYQGRSAFSVRRSAFSVQRSAFGVPGRIPHIGERSPTIPPARSKIETRTTTRIAPFGGTRLLLIMRSVGPQNA